MRHKLLAVTIPVVAVMLASCADAPTSPRTLAPSAKPSLAAALTITDNTSSPVAIGAFVPCANNGAGDFIVLTGDLHVLLHITLNGNNLTIKEHFQPQGLSGLGVDGTKYQATGVTQDVIHQNIVTGLPFNDTFVNNFRIIGQGPGNNLLVHENFHVTVNPDGTVTSFHDNFSIDCK